MSTLYLVQYPVQSRRRPSPSYTEFDKDWTEIKLKRSVWPVVWSVSAIHGIITNNKRTKKEKNRKELNMVHGAKITGGV